MYAMQYEIPLPADYDTSVIRRRVAEKAPLLDQFPGLGLKAYLLRERGIHGADSNLYAPFYLWASVAGMNRFLWGGGGFANIVSFIGRTPVNHWTGVRCIRGPACMEAPKFATRSIEPLAGAGDPAVAVEQALAELRQRARHPLAHTSSLAIDPQSWTAVHFTLWRERLEDEPGTWFQVLHLSTPHLEDIAET